MSHADPHCGTCGGVGCDGAGMMPCRDCGRRRRPTQAPRPTARPTARNIDTVLADILGLVPADEGELVRKLSAIRATARYRAPETMGLCWRDAQDVLWEAFGGDPDPDGWRGEVLRVWRGER